MRNWTLFITVLTLACPTCNAQSDYTKLLKGERNPYDTAVAIQITQYRSIRAKLNVGDTYINSLRKTIDSLNAQINTTKQLMNTQMILITKQEDFARKNEQSFNDLYHQFDKLADELSRPKKWYERPLIIGGGTFLLAETIRAIITR